MHIEVIYVKNLIEFYCTQGHKIDKYTLLVPLNNKQSGLWIG